MADLFGPWESPLGGFQGFHHYTHCCRSIPAQPGAPRLMGGKGSRREGLARGPGSWPAEWALSSCFPSALGTIVSVIYTISCLGGLSPFGADSVNTLRLMGAPCLGLELSRITRTPPLQLQASCLPPLPKAGLPVQGSRAGRGRVLSLGPVPTGCLPWEGSCEQAQVCASLSLGEASTVFLAGAWH